MILARGEKLILREKARLIQDEHDALGTLSLTTVRIVFEAGVGGPSPYTAFDADLETVSNAHAGSSSKLFEGYREFLTIEGDARRVVFEVPGAVSWVNAITDLKQNSPPPAAQPEPARSRAPGSVVPSQVVVNIPAQEAPKIMMHCRNCGNLYDATKGRCDKCGAPPT
jgi:hypothetical protein